MIDVRSAHRLRVNRNCAIERSNTVAHTRETETPTFHCHLYIKCHAPINDDEMNLP
jgi:hypothetical protein